jgi:hypothetical protein
VVAEFFQGSVGLFGDGGAEFGLMPDVEGAAAVDGRAGRDLGGLGESLEEGTDPLGGDGVLAGDRRIGQAGLAIGEHALTQVEGVSHNELRGAKGVTRIVTQTASERKRETETALAFISHLPRLQYPPDLLHQLRAVICDEFFVFSFQLGLQMLKRSSVVVKPEQCRRASLRGQSLFDLHLERGLGLSQLLAQIVIEQVHDRRAVRIALFAVGCLRHGTERTRGSELIHLWLPEPHLLRSVPLSGNLSEPTPYRDKAKNSAYQNEWLQRRRREWLAANGLTCPRKVIQVR